jgi:iron complex outermembrane receptor protein
MSKQNVRPCRPDKSDQGSSSGYIRKRLYLTTSVLCGLGALLFGAAPAMADDQPTDNSSVSEIVITGSRLRNANDTSTSPVTTVSGDEAKVQGFTRAEDMLNTLPQAFADQGGNDRGGAAGASGTATINLRNLGNQRTLVLIDGRRLMPGDPDRVTAQAPDINNIPTALIDRVEVVTGGASAVYGSDAIAGVVNFITKKNFSGIQVDAQYGGFQDDNDNNVQKLLKSSNIKSPTGSVWDGGQGQISLLMGVNAPEERGNITGYFVYRNIDEVSSGSRDYSACTLGTSATGLLCSLSGSTYPAQIQLSNPATGLRRGAYTIDSTTGNTLRTYNNNTDGFNIGNTYGLQLPDQRYNAGLIGNYSLTPKIEFYTQMMFMDDKSTYKISPTATYLDSFNVNCNNPLMSTQEQNLICTSVGLTPTQSATINLGERNVQGGSREESLDHTSYRFVGGFRGDIDKNWNYDAYAQFGRTNYAEGYNNDYSLAHVRNALDDVVNPANGQVVCASVLSGTDTSCVPFNIYQTNGITPAALKYLEVYASETGSTTEQVVSGSISGDLTDYGIKLPWADKGASVVFGSEYRQEALTLKVDQEWASGDLAADGARSSVSGNYHVYELFTEARLPLASDLPFIKDLSLEGGFRYSHYSTSGDNNSYKIAGEYAPISDLRFRASFERAARAPNTVELYAPQRQTFQTATDPCEGAVPVASLANCERSGVTAAQYGNIPNANGQAYGEILGGNPNLKPEVANTVSAGFVYSPHYIPGLTLSADYFNIDVEKVIGVIGINLTISQCIQTGSPYFCSLIHRDPGSGSLINSPGVDVSNINLNTGSLKTAGIDINGTYSVPLNNLAKMDLGHLALNLAGTYTTEYAVQPLPGLGSYDCVGLFGLTCGQPNPRWRHILRATWETPWNVEVAGSWRFIDGTQIDKSSSNTFLAAPVVTADDHLPSISYFDLSATFHPRKSLDLRVGINNIFDKDPPLTASAGGIAANGNYFAGMYDSLGRYLFVGLTARF